MTGFSPVHLLVLQPTSFCNIQCRYCYLPHRDLKRRISLETIDALMENLQASRLLSDSLNVVWHAGEPLVMGPDFYERAFTRLDQAIGHTVRLRLSIQTNGTLIDDSFCDLFARWGVCVGISLDGPAFLHDRHRLTRSGQGTFDRTLAGIDRLRQRNIPFHVITVLTTESLNQARELYEFYVTNGIRSVAFNVEEKEGVNQSAAIMHRKFESGYERFMAAFLELTLRDDVLRVREFARMETLMLSGRFLKDTIQAHPFGILSVDTEGRFTTFSPEFLDAAWGDSDDFILGDVRRGLITDAMRTPKFHRLYVQILDGLAACAQSCRYFPVCGGGAPSNKFFENGTMASTETQFCRITKMRLAEVVLASLEKRSENQATHTSE